MAAVSNLRSGEDHHEYFDTKAYLSDYWSGISEEKVDWTHFSMRSFHEAWSQMPNKNLRILEFGGGPTISNLISAAPYAKEIIFADYTESNRRATEAWRQKSRDSHDWSSYFKFVVQTLEGKESDEVFIREAELRKKLSNILPCDIGLEDPVNWPSSWPSQSATFDVVSTSLCLEAVVTSPENYRHAIAKLRNYLKPGGYVLEFGVLGQSFYMVGKEKFYTFPLSKDIIKETFAKEGFQVLDLKAISLGEENAVFSDAQEMFFLRAGLQN